MRQSPQTNKNHPFRCLVVIAVNWILVCLTFCSSAAAQELAIGVPLVEQSLNLVESGNPFAQLVLHSTTQPLLRVDSSKNNKVQLVLADSFSTSLDGKSVEIRLRAGASFINSKMVGESDLVSSLGRCIGAVFKTADSNGLTFNVYTKEQRIYVSISGQQEQSDIFSFLASCPIFEERSTKLFGRDLGSANLLLATGPYQLVSRNKNREARMERVSKSNAWASALTVRGFADSVHALTALRTGTIDAVYTQDLEVTSKAMDDPTLLTADCGVYNIILRKGLEITCFSIQDPGSVKYTAL